MKNEEPDFRAIYKEFHAQMDRPGFRPLIRSASKLFDAPVVFTDEKYQLVSLYPAEKIDDDVYDTLLEKGALPEETIAAFHQSYLLKPGRHYDPFYEKSGLVENYPRIFAEIYDESRVYGHVAVFQKDFEPWHLEATAILADVLRIKINLSKQLPSLRSNILHDLLNRDTTLQAGDRIINHLLKSASAPFLLLVAPLDQSKSQYAMASIAISYLIHKFSSAIPVIYQDDLVILVTHNCRHPDLTVTAEKIADYLSHYQILCGCVYPVTDLHHLPDFYLQGRLTALYSYWSENKSLPSVPLYYHQVAPAPLFLYLSQKEYSKCFLHSSLDSVKSYDKTNDTHYYSTLVAYCRHLFQKNQTSEALHIHRNTLNYRLDKIKDLFGLNLDDYQTVLQLLISIEVMGFYD